jgi:excisionase family DNA binding protein
MADQNSNGIAPLWTDEEAAAYLRVKVSTIQKWAKNGDIPVRKAGSLNRFDPAEIEEWTRAGRMPADDSAAA